METLKLILSLIPIILAAISASYAFITAWKTKVKAKKAEAEAKTEAERAQAEAERAAAELDMEQAAKTFIAEAETLYKAYDDILKQRGQSAGALKKETVLAKLRTYAIEKGVSLDANEWSERVDKLVKFTKAVNSKQ
jgi:uncharacterized membrane protein YqiK